MKNTVSRSVSRFSYSAVIILAFLFIFVDVPSIDIPFVKDVKDAEARVGRPATPGSVGGVHRRTRRRAVRRHIAIGTRVTVLPAGCTIVITRGVSYRYCGEVYYRPYYEGTTLVYVVVEQP